VNEGNPTPINPTREERGLYGPRDRDEAIDPTTPANQPSAEQWKPTRYHEGRAFAASDQRADRQSVAAEVVRMDQSRPPGADESAEASDGGDAERGSHIANGGCDACALECFQQRRAGRRNDQRLPAAGSKSESEE
jgi:hypothetical protein